VKIMEWLFSQKIGPFQEWKKDAFFINIIYFNFGINVEWNSILK
jgi:hypothetical protein